MGFDQLALCIVYLLVKANRVFLCVNLFYISGKPTMPAWNIIPILSTTRFDWLPLPIFMFISSTFGVVHSGEYTIFFRLG